MPTRFIFGTTGPDNLIVPDGRDSSVAYDNIVYGFGGDDNIVGGTGNDWVWGSTSDTSFPAVFANVSGGAGDDVIVGYGNGSLLDGETGNDVIIYSGPGGSNGVTTTLQGGNGDDQLWTLNEASLFGGNGNDTLVGGQYLDGGAGDDLLITTVNQSKAYGSLGNDTLYAGSGVTGSSLNGGIGADVLVGNGLGDQLIPGNDQLQDVLIGGNGPDEFDIGGHGDSITLPTDILMRPQTPIPSYYLSTLHTDIIWNFQVGVDNLVLPTADYYSPLAPAFTLPNTTYVAASGYNSDLGLSGTLIRWEGSVINPFDETTVLDMVFLAGVTTDINTLTNAGSLHFNDAVVNY
jgi:Ca2+-binding RTX toxin-like protein